ncbi:MAG: hypothetical protein ACE5HC_16975, partial [Candidatus Binatia bacterium]
MKSTWPSGHSFAQWGLVTIGVVLPIVPASLLFFRPQPTGETTISLKAIGFVVLWVIFGIISVLVHWYRAGQRERWKTGGTFIAYLTLCSVPVLLFGVWLFSGPYLHEGSLHLFAASCLLPLCFILAWDLGLNKLSSKFTRTELILPGASTVITLVLFELVAHAFFTTGPPKGNLAVNSPDRSYWYFVRAIGPDGTNRANSFGFLGPEPAPNYSGIRVLVVGDSIPAAGRAINFPKVAETLYTTNRGSNPKVEIVNASMGSYSLQQITHYYINRLRGLSHDILIVSFYLDDINREMRYVKGNIQYTPSWPEWMQDTYYSCYLCRVFLNFRAFTRSTFSLYRRASYEEAFPAALNNLEAIRVVAERRGAKFSVFNIPRFNWTGILSDTRRYKYSGMNHQLESWCRKRKVPYHDT